MPSFTPGWAISWPRKPSVSESVRLPWATVVPNGLSRLRPLDVDVDPLVVARDLGELVDVLLGDLDPVGGAELRADQLADAAIELDLEGRHGGKASIRRGRSRHQPHLQRARPPRRPRPSAPGCGRRRPGSRGRAARSRRRRPAPGRRCRRRARADGAELVEQVGHQVGLGVDRGNGVERVAQAVGGRGRRHELGDPLGAGGRDRCRVEAGLGHELRRQQRRRDAPAARRHA